MSGFFGDNPTDTVVGSTDATESTIAEDAVAQTDTAGGFYQGSPDQTTTDAYTADALASKNAAAISEELIVVECSDLRLRILTIEHECLHFFLRNAR